MAEPRAEHPVTVQNTWRAVDAWFDANDARHNMRDRRAPASLEAISTLSTQLGRSLPKQLVNSLRVHDGGGDFESYGLLGCQEIASWFRVLHQRADGATRWPEEWIPFAADSGGNLFCVNARSAVFWVEWRPARSGKLARSLKLWLQNYLSRLEAGILIVDNEGFVAETVIAPSVVGGVTLPAVPDADSSALITAVETDDVGSVLLALRAIGLGLDVTVQYGTPLLSLAASKGAKCTLAALLAGGANPDAGAAAGKRTALFWACWGMRAELEMVELLLQYRADPNAQTAYDGTPLHSAVMWDQHDIIRALIAAGADPSRKDAKGRSAHDAARGPTRELLDLLAPL